MEQRNSFRWGGGSGMLRGRSVQLGERELWVRRMRG